MDRCNVKKGQTYKIIGYDCGRKAEHKLSTMGLVKDKVFKIKAIQPVHGPYTIELDKIEISIGRGLFNKLICEEI